MQRGQRHDVTDRDYQQSNSTGTQEQQAAHRRAYQQPIVEEPAAPRRSTPYFRSQSHENDQQNPTSAARDQNAYVPASSYPHQPQAYQSMAQPQLQGYSYQAPPHPQSYQAYPPQPQGYGFAPGPPVTIDIDIELFGVRVRQSILYGATYQCIHAGPYYVPPSGLQPYWTPPAGQHPHYGAYWQQPAPYTYQQPLGPPRPEPVYAAPDQDPPERSARHERAARGTTDSPPPKVPRVIPPAASRQHQSFRRNQSDQHDQRDLKNLRQRLAHLHDDHRRVRDPPQPGPRRELFAEERSWLSRTAPGRLSPVGSDIEDGAAPAKQLANIPHPRPEAQPEVESASPLGETTSERIARRVRERYGDPRPEAQPEVESASPLGETASERIARRVRERFGDPQTQSDQQYNPTPPAYPTPPVQHQTAAPRSPSPDSRRRRDEGVVIGRAWAGEGCAMPSVRKAKHLKKFTKAQMDAYNAER